MNFWIDSHCHLHYGKLYENVEQTVRNAELNNVKYMLCVSTDIGDAKKINEFTKYDSVYQSIGIHPLSSLKYTLNQIREYLSHVQAKKLIAIGETGLDDFREPLDTHQIDSFRIHIEHAVKHDLPIIMHTRNGQNSVVEQEAKKLLSQYEVRGVAHCFGGSLEFAQFLLDKGWYISFAGNLTYKSAKHLQAVAVEIPIERILIETDAPFLAPEPHRGKDNEPAFVVEVGKKLAQLKNMTTEEVQKYTSNNFRTLFGVE